MGLPFLRDMVGEKLLMGKEELEREYASSAFRINSRKKEERDLVLICDR